MQTRNEPRYYYMDSMPGADNGADMRIIRIFGSEALERVCLEYPTYTGTEILRLITQSEDRPEGIDFEAVPHTELYEGVCDQVEFMLHEYDALGIHAEVAAKLQAHVTPTRQKIS